MCPRPPEVLFATLNVDKKVYEVGEEVEYTCRPGFMPNNGQRKYTCLPTGKWAFNTLLCLREYLGLNRTFIAKSWLCVSRTFIAKFWLCLNREFIAEF